MCHCFFESDVIIRGALFSFSNPGVPLFTIYLFTPMFFYENKALTLTTTFLFWENVNLTFFQLGKATRGQRTLDVSWPDDKQCRLVLFWLKQNLVLESNGLKVSQFQNGFTKTSFLPKYERKIVRISALYSEGGSLHNFLFVL